MTNGEIARLRRQMQRRIRAVVAERRMARYAAPTGADEPDQGPEPGQTHLPQPIEG
ncbi:hypothetical protein [Micromonospora sp. HM5-17]|jgi:hypothetical protein|uniref:hypothetical protein n=1 Tax=Micromonospora sp. HM5-17 TaxID=2487710 RepID=UPI0018F32148|nr:hypothetical protein [Micromonospora sp. HM5-17]